KPRFGSSPLHSGIFDQALFVKTRQSFCGGVLRSIKSLEHLLELRVLLTELFGQQPLELLVFRIKDGQLLEGNRILASPGLRVWIFVCIHRDRFSRVGMGTLGALSRSAL